jgi:WD40 repeat protein
MVVKIFFCYAHEDERLLNKLKSHLSPLRRQRLIEIWHDRDISAGLKWEKEINKNLNEADIILLLISPDFMDSDYCYGKEMQRALERDQRGEARAIPVILRPVYWQSVLGTLQALPRDGQPIISTSWHTEDEAFLNVVNGIRKVIEDLIPKPSILPPEPVKTEQKEKQPVPAIKPKKFNLIHTLTDHSKGVTAVAINPDGHRLVSGSFDNTIKLWDLHTGALLGNIIETNPFHEVSLGVRSIVISPDGCTLVSGSPMSITIRNFQNGEILNRIINSGDNKALAIAADNTTLVSAEEETIKVWNPSTGELLNTLKANEAEFEQVLTGDDLSIGEIFNAFKGYFGEVQSLAISPDGRTLMSGDDENNIMVWNLLKGKLLKILEGHSHTFGGTSNEVTTLAFSPDGHTLVSGGSHFTISIWDIRSGKLVRTLTKHAYPVTSLAMSPDGYTFVSAGTSDAISLWNLHTGELLNTVSNPGSMKGNLDSIWEMKERVNFVSSLAMSPDGKYLVSGNSDSTIHIWEIN